MDWAHVIGRLVAAIPRPAGRALLLPLLVVPSLRKADRVFGIVHELERLERNGKFDAAEALREEALQQTAPDFSAPLWGSKGFDRLRRGRADEALAAFERAIAQLGGRPAMYGVSRPDALYYGAAVAALDLGEREKAKGYYRTSVSIVAGSSAGARRWWDARHEDLRRRLGEPTRG